jgi:large subunit ribosomal protein L9
MQVVLLERITKLGQMGDVVTVKDGYARNFLLPSGKALRANKANLERFESQRAQLEAQNLEQKSEAEGVKAKLDEVTVVIIRQSSETGQLYGSVNSRDIAESLTENGFSVNRDQIELNKPIKTLGMHTTIVNLHPEVSSSISVNVARTEEEAERQARGEDVTVETQDAPEEVPNTEEIFEEGVEAQLASQETDEESGEEAVEASAEEAPAETSEEAAPETETDTEES